MQPDTLIPDPSNPQAWNRYSYALNNPILYNDPSGHKVCEGDADSFDTCNAYGSVEDELLGFGIRLTETKGEWSRKHKNAALLAAQLVGSKFSEIVGGTAEEAFRKVYGLNDGDNFKAEWDEDCWGCREDPTGCDLGTTRGDACNSEFGYTNTENWIEFASMSAVQDPLRNMNNVIHEFGHAFDLRLGRIPGNALNARADLLVNDVGFYGYPGNRTWEASSGTTGSETFGDQFLGWVYGKWGSDPLGPTRAEFMNAMNGPNGWVAQAAGLP